MQQLIRHCPKCNKQIKYKTIQSFKVGNKKDSKCKTCTSLSCAGKYTRPDNSGKNNPMYGRSVESVWVEKYGQEEATRRLDEFKHKCSINNKRSMTGRSVESVWVEKYGQEEATRRLDEVKKKQSHRSSGVKNPMYGKPAPIGSGNGWSGWYKSNFFRSLLELSYLKMLIDNNIQFENGECRKHKISLEDGKNYFPDYYLVDSQEMIEIKPFNLLKTEANIQKFKAAKDKFGDNFKILTEKDIIRLSFDEINILYKSGDLLFIDRYEKKFKEKYYDSN